MANVGTVHQLAHIECVTARGAEGKADSNVESAPK